MPKKQAKKKRRGSAKVVVEQGSESCSAVAAPPQADEMQLAEADAAQADVAVSGAKARGRDEAEDSGDDDDDDDDQLVFEDPYEDEYESDGDAAAQEHEEDGGDGTEMDELEDQLRVWRPGIDTLGEDEVLDYDSSTYQTFHRMTLEWPCLSFDIVRDGLGEQRDRFPLTMYAVAGTQADTTQRGVQNSLLVLKMSQLNRTQHDSDDEADSDSDEDEGDAVLEHKAVQHNGAVNRVKCQTQCPNIVATWAETGSVHVFDVAKQLALLDGPLPAGEHPPSSSAPPLQTFDGHTMEGFALDWSDVAPGRLASGDCSGSIHLWEPSEGGSWAVGGASKWHTSSVEDLQWSPAEPAVLASCSADHNICVWDARVGNTKPGATILGAHDADVNVISWNKLVNYLLVSGGDDGIFRIWDLRTLRSSGEAPPPAAHFKHHNAPITSIEWSPHDSSCIAVSGADDQVTIWDMSVERDAEDEAEAVAAGVADIPAQLMFVHQGQRDVKEVHWHPQIPGLVASTAADGLNVFRTANWGGL